MKYRLALCSSLIALLLVATFSQVMAFNSNAPKRLAAKDYAQVDAFVTARMKELNIPGVAVGIVRGSEVLYLQGYGVADPQGRPVTPQTPFMIGSLSKSMTALAVLQLAEQGKIDLAAPVNTYLPGFHLANEADSSPISVRQLLIQTSGIPGSASGDYGDDRLTAEAFVDGINALDLSLPPGQVFQYSDANYVILGLIVENASGLPYAEYIQKHVFAPLEMQHSYTAKETAAQNGLSTGYRTMFGFPVPADLPYPRRYLPSGLVISSAEDLTHYLQLFLNQGQYQSASIVSANSVRELQRPAVTLEHPAGYAYAMGWYVSDQYQTHPGELSNYYAIMQLTPADKTGIVVLANANNKLVTGEYTRSIATGISDLLAGQEAPPLGFGFRQIYLIFDLVVLGMLLFLVQRLFRSMTLRSTWAKQPGSSAIQRWLAAVGMDLIVLAFLGGAFWYLLSAYHTTLSNAMLGQPDLVIAFYALIGLACINVFSRLMFISFRPASSR